MVIKKFYSSAAAFSFISDSFDYNYINEETHIYFTFKSDACLIITFKDLNNVKYKIIVESSFHDLSVFVDKFVVFHTYLTISYKHARYF